MNHSDLLLSLPAGSAAAFQQSYGDRAEQMFATSDPPGTQVGSGGGTAHLLVEAWRHACRAEPNAAPSFETWIQQSRKLLIHGSGESRRLPPYAAEGKPLIPIPPNGAESGCRPDEMLVDLQARSYNRFFWHAPDTYRVMVTCGDVLIRFQQWLPTYPDVDVLIVGLMASPEEAQRHGVMICPPDDPNELLFFLQKPPAERIRQLAESHAYYLDTGIWLLSPRAVAVLMDKCGWSASKQSFAHGTPDPYDMYARFGPSLGADQPSTDPSGSVDPDIRALQCAVLPLGDARFYHFGTNRSLLASAWQLQRPSAKQRSFGHASMEPRAQPLVQNSVVTCPLTPANRHIWIDNSHLGAGWTLAEQNVITGAPPNDWTLALQAGDCLDFVPVSDAALGECVCVRFYGFDDMFRGDLQDDDTLWLGRRARDWFEHHGIEPAAAGVELHGDIQAAALFPLCRIEDLDGDLLQWLLAATPEDRPALRARWQAAPRLSARDLLRRADVAGIASARHRQRRQRFAEMDTPAWADTCSRLDLAATARIVVREQWSQPQPLEAESANHGGLACVHDRMFRAAISRLNHADDAAPYEAEAFGGLRSLIVDKSAVDPVSPSRNILEDQIIWGRSPVRLDLAGGWSDTPPYCLEHGGRVVNVAVDLNGQPPIQVFARVAREPAIVIRSIDLGIEDRVTTYEELLQCDQLGSGFGIARAALALAGLAPRFHAEHGYTSLRTHLDKEFGGGLEITMLAAIPKGSGLGTSSILAATLLGTLSELCGLYWNSNNLFERTLALEQMLTSGGGWQDQAGGVIGGLKLLETEPGLAQRPIVRWLPGRFFGEDYANRLLLYYTGLTRVAHDILGEVVRRIFLNSADQLNIIRDISVNALYAADAIQRHDWNGLCEAVRRSWRLNQGLDEGTNPASVQAILDQAGPDVQAAKLLGAGGGGYMLLLAEDAAAGQRIRQRLTEGPPNPRARFVEMQISDTGFQATRS